MAANDKGERGHEAQAPDVTGEEEEGLTKFPPEEEAASAQIIQYALRSLPCLLTCATGVDR